MLVSGCGGPVTGSSGPSPPDIIDAIAFHLTVDLLRALRAVCPVCPV